MPCTRAFPSHNPASVQLKHVSLRQSSLLGILSAYLKNSSKIAKASELVSSRATAQFDLVLPNKIATLRSMFRVLSGDAFLGTP